jgi:hypothetical protein
MAELMIDNAIAERLRQIAQQENRPVDSSAALDARVLLA